MKKRIMMAYLIAAQLAGVLLGGLLIYAEGHHRSSLYMAFTNFGFHLR